MGHHHCATRWHSVGLGRHLKREETSWKPKQRKRHRIGGSGGETCSSAKAFRFLLVLVIALVIVYIFADQIVWRRVVSQRAEFAQRFGTITADGLMPELPPAQDDAGRYYRYAWSLIAKANGLYGGFDPYTALHDKDNFADAMKMDEPPAPDVVEDYVRRKLAAAQPGLDVALRAATFDHGVLSPTNDPEVILPTLAEARGLARYLCARAEIAARDGDTDLTLAYVRATLHLANTLGENGTLIVQLVQIAVVGIAFPAAQQVVTDADVSPDEFAAILDETRSLRDPESFVRTLTGDYLFMRDRQHEAGPRLWWSLNELRMTDVLIAMVDAVRAKDIDRQRELLAQARQTAEKGPYVIYALTQVTAPALLRSIDAWQRMEAQASLLEIGLAISRFHAEHGEYPEALALVAPYLRDGMPDDPFAGASSVYERRGEGYVLYSVGPDLIDDGGTKPLRCKGGDCTGDIIWAIGQPAVQSRAESDSSSVRQRGSRNRVR